MDLDGTQGLINSRALGDTIGTSCGVICDADVKRMEFREKDLFLLLCSDGVAWSL